MPYWYSEKAIELSGTLATILSENGACFVVVSGKRRTGTGQPMALKAELSDLGIDLINARPYHHRTNCKLE